MQILLIENDAISMERLFSLLETECLSILTFPFEICACSAEHLDRTKLEPMNIFETVTSSHFLWNT